MKARQASWQSSSWARTFFSRGCLRGSLVQLHRRSFPLDLEIITLLRVLLGGGLEKMKHTEHRIGCDHTGKATAHLIWVSEGSWNTPEVVVGELLQRVGFSFILLVRKGYVGQTDGFSPLIRSHGHESLRGRRREKEGSRSYETKNIHRYFSVRGRNTIFDTHLRSQIWVLHWI